MIIRVLPSAELDRVRDQVFAPFGRAMAAVAATYSPAELATITSYLRRVTDVLHEHTARLTAAARPGERASLSAQTARTGERAVAPAP